jgi:hypothetical protein
VTNFKKLAVRIEREHAEGINPADAAGRWLAENDPANAPTPSSARQAPLLLERAAAPTSLTLFPASPATPKACGHQDGKLTELEEHPDGDVAEAWRCKCGELVIRLLPHPSQLLGE